MSLYTAGFHFNKFVVIESLEDHEVRTGGVLVELLHSVILEHAPKLSVEYIICDNAIEFRSILRRITEEATSMGHIPVLHIECHGSKMEGLEFANGSRISWQDLAADLTELNIACEFNLLAVLSSCFGGYLLGEITAMAPAACWAVVAPTMKVDPAECMRGFRIFYTTLITLADAGKATDALRDDRLSEGDWFAQLAQLWYERLIIEYVRTHCTKAAIRQRATRMYRKARREGIPGSVGGFSRRLQAHHRSVLTGQYFDSFFCTARVRSASERFDLVRQRVSKKLSELQASGDYQL